MERLKAHVQKKQTLILVFLGVILALSFSAVSTTTSYLYRSRADENPDVQRTEQDSVAIETIDTRLYSCIKNLSFLPDNEGNGCFAQFECRDNVNQNIPPQCSQKNDTITCTAATSQCISRQEWIKSARSICGC